MDIKCKQFYSMFNDYEGFFKYGVGAFLWGRLDYEFNENYILIILPSNKPVPTRLRVKYDSDIGGKDGKGYWWSWDGNFYRPSLLSSIQAPNWHGYLWDGIFTDRIPDDAVNILKKDRERNVGFKFNF